MKKKVTKNKVKFDFLIINYYSVSYIQTRTYAENFT